jgi:hypothetical protein
MAALALACVAAGGGATSAALAQNPPDSPEKPDRPAPRAVQVMPQPAPGSPDAPTPPPANPNDERRRAIELYRAQFGGQLTKATYLGVSTSPVPGALRQHLGLPEGLGLVVDFVEPDSPAQKAGLKQYDILTKLDDQILVNAQQLAVVVRTHKSGDEVKIKLIRGGKEQSLSAKLVEKEVKPIGDLFGGWAGPLEADEQDLQRSLMERMRDRRNRGEGQPPRPGGGADRRDGPRGAAVNGDRTMMVWRDNDMTLTLSRRGPEHRHLVVTDKSGKTIFDGDLDDQDQRAKLPPNVAEKLRQMESKLPPEAKGGGGPQSRELRNNREFKLEGSAHFNGNQDVERQEEIEIERDAADDAPRGSADRSPIGDNDVLSIELRGVHGPGTSTVKAARVRDGRVNLPMVAPVQCAGLTEDQLEKQIVQAYAKVNPSVSVQVKRVARMDGKDAKDDPHKP